jgi:hypothetical protein
MSGSAVQLQRFRFLAAILHKAFTMAILVTILQRVMEDPPTP